MSLQALGCLLYIMAYNKLPFPQENKLQVSMCRLHLFSLCCLSQITQRCLRPYASQQMLHVVNMLHWSWLICVAGFKWRLLIAQLPRPSHYRPRETPATGASCDLVLAELAAMPQQTDTVQSSTKVDR